MKRGISFGAAALPTERRVLARRGWVGEKSGLFEHPAWCTPVIPDVQISEIPACPRVFPQPANGQLAGPVPPTGSYMGYVTSEGHPRSLVFVWGVLQVGLPSFPAEQPLRLRSCPSYNTPHYEAPMPFSIRPYPLQ